MVFLSKSFVANFKSANHVRFLQELKTLGSEEPELYPTGGHLHNFDGGNLQASVRPGLVRLQLLFRGRLRAGPIGHESGDGIQMSGPDGAADARPAAAATPRREDLRNVARIVRLDDLLGVTGDVVTVEVLGEFEDRGHG